MAMLTEIRRSILQLVFPHICDGCGSDMLDEESRLCIRCLARLPETGFHMHANNPAEKIFWGRIPLAAATAQYYFTKESLIQKLMHQFKYRSDQALGMMLGRLMGIALAQTNRFLGMDALVPLPLFSAKERKRGFNQATVLCEGISEILNIPVLTKAVIRSQHTETQTRKGRMERWINMEGKFEIRDPGILIGKKILLVDDVITTGATLEACGTEIIEAGVQSLSIAALCIAGK